MNRDIGESSPGDPRCDSSLELGVANVRLVRLDTLDQNFGSQFEEYKGGFLRVLAHSYASYYGDDYHLKRIVEDRSVIYLALTNSEVVAVSYVKRNLRRGGTAVYPKEYRRLGLAEALVSASLMDFPEQYSILGLSNSSMIRLLLKLGFVRATSIDQVRQLTADEFRHLSNFATLDDGIVFRRYSTKRSTDRRTLTLLYRASHATA